jgi:hypothetical protein
VQGGFLLARRGFMRGFERFAMNFGALFRIADYTRKWTNP